ncbi:dienelactone hydrolase family protein [Methylocystis bryophila]|uniref:Carboxymethylenebutenolidase n=1 Tax=Methylocystis bryophila TaxID=655015 RepID=A0A1W6MV17_9HYPH|nr:dienelactone hydrolase family protein [Methylocystis bryophila]ARN81407.1 carboxymethylenebutenolidase [Methylocystis bryophila]BDV37404.1 putative carboxymethylenebutenolidase [Methylocystis bryophila]
MPQPLSQGAPRPIDAKEARIGDMPAYMARPTEAAHPPILIIVAEIFGLNDHIRDVVRRFAAEGYLAIAPDFFFRVGDPAKETDLAAIRAIIMKVPDEEAMRDFDAALAFADSSGGDAARAAITGFCWGGRMAWLYAAHNPKLKAVVPWYGRLDGERTKNQPQWPIDVADRLSVPYLGLYGGADPSIPPPLVEQMRARLSAAPAKGEIMVYPDAPHAFFADYRESYRDAPARDAFARMLAFLKTQGAA